MDTRLDFRVQQDENDAGQLTTTSATTSPIQRSSSSTGQQHYLIHQQRQIYEEQLQKLSDELAELESVSQELVEVNKSLSSRLNKCQRNNEDLQVKTSSLADKLEEALNANLELNLRLGRAESEIKVQERLLRKTHDEDEVLVRVIGDKLESLQKTLAERDEEIKRLRLDNQLALESHTMNVVKNEDENTNHPHLVDASTLTSIDEHVIDESQMEPDDSTIEQPVISLELNNALSTAQDRLRLLESENELLELAMKEILLSLKSSDARYSTLLIDCPSLEKFCQLIEARFLSQDCNVTEMTVDERGISNKILFQLVVLKSELDLLRGQNEELRTNAKIQFRERMEQLKHLSSDKEISKIADQVELRVSQASQTDSSPVATNEIKCKNCSKLTNLTKNLLHCIVRVETRLRVGDEIYTSRLFGLNQMIQILEKDLLNSERQLDETRRELHQQNQRKLSMDGRLQYIQDQLSFHMKFCSMSQMNTSQPRVGAENLQIYTTSKSGNGDSIESYTISQKTASHLVPHHDTRIRDPRLTITILQSIISCLQARIDFKDDRLKQLEQLLFSETTNDPSTGAEQEAQGPVPIYNRRDKSDLTQC